MRLVEFLIQILEAHAQTLAQLSALLGEERLAELLDESCERADLEQQQTTGRAGLSTDLAAGNEDHEQLAEEQVSGSIAVLGSSGTHFTTGSGTVSPPAHMPNDDGGFGSDGAAEGFSPPVEGGDGDSYAELEEAIAALNLPPMLETHLWSYPKYRDYIEGPVDLDARIPGPGHDLGLKLVDDAVAAAAAWVRDLAIADDPRGEGVDLPPTQRQRAENASHMAWLRFRTMALKRIGRRPMGPVH